VGVFDIVLCRPNVERVDLRARMLAEEVNLGYDVVVGPVPKALARGVSELCDPHRLRVAPGDARPPVRYGFRRNLPDGTNVAAFDVDGRLTAAIALSRLSNPTSVGFEWSARVSSTVDDPIHEATPGFIKGAGSQAFVVSGGRDWLTRDDADEIALLLDAYRLQERTMEGRVRRALWRHEYAARVDELDIRWLIVASGLEALVKINYPRRAGGPGSTRQFRMRTVALATRLRINWTEAQAERAYELRSDIAHGAKVTGGPPDLPLYRIMETILRSALKRALLDAQFQALFATDASVEAAFPV
jgi:hypothetical protein